MDEYNELMKEWRATITGTKRIRETHNKIVKNLTDESAKHSNRFLNQVNQKQNLK